jgi:hypothetical protein
MVTIWRAKKAEVYIGDKIDTLSSTTTIFSQLTGTVTWSGEIKDIEISGGETDTETIYFLGSNASGQQNAVKDPQNMTDIEFSGTLAFKDIDSLALALTAPSAVGSTGYDRVLGDTNQTEKAIVVKFASGSDVVTVLLNNSYFTKIPGVSLEAEGHAESEIAAKCLAKDYAAEDNFSQ